MPEQNQWRATKSHLWRCLHRSLGRQTRCAAPTVVISAANNHQVKKILTTIAQGVEKEEPGCLQYEVTFQEDTGDFVVVEKYDIHNRRYVNADALATHRKQSYYTSAFKQFEDAISGPPDLKVLKVVAGFASRK